MSKNTITRYIYCPILQYMNIEKVRMDQKIRKTGVIQQQNKVMDINESHPIFNLRIRDVLIRIRVLFSSVAIKMPNKK
jgi:hypothetical protein